MRDLIVTQVRNHSRKPWKMRVDLAQMFAGPNCELFARERVDGWDARGDQLAAEA